MSLESPPPPSLSINTFSQPFITFNHGILGRIPIRPWKINMSLERLSSIHPTMLSGCPQAPPILLLSSCFDSAKSQACYQKKVNKQHLAQWVLVMMRIQKQQHCICSVAEMLSYPLLHKMHNRDTNALIVTSPKKSKYIARNWTFVTTKSI